MVPVRVGFRPAICTHRVARFSFHGHFLPVSIGTILLLASAPSFAQVDTTLATAELRRAIGQRPWVRVESYWTTARILKPRVAATGLEFSQARPDEPGADVGSLPNPIPLARIYKVEAQVNGCGRGAILGAVVGAVVGVLTVQAVANLSGIMSSHGAEDASTGELVGGAAVGAVPGALLGALVGSLFRDMKQVYPQDPAPDLQARVRLTPATSGPQGRPN